ncbi:MAG: substrate-binding domain-containing protein [Alphaproteobacteria bacterium]|nr:substrate-binding domain-containing protein [Alphaproteobacteria bacterium]
MPNLSTLVISVLLLVSTAARAAELSVVSSGGFAAALKALAPAYEHDSGNRLVLGWGPSMGDTRDAVPARLARGERIDVVIMVGDALSNLIEQGKADRGSRIDLARSLIGAAVRSGAPHPDIATPDAFRRTLLEAKSIAYSDSASGVYLSSDLFKRLGISEQLKDKARMIAATPVGEIVARGEAEIGFQQIAELKPVPGIDLLGPIPAALQKVTIYSAAIVATSQDKSVATSFIAYLAARKSAPVIADTGLEPVQR